jgi:hypothetical protein
MIMVWGKASVLDLHLLRELAEEGGGVSFSGAEGCCLFWMQLVKQSCPREQASNAGLSAVEC